MELAETGPEICGSERGKGQQCGDDSRPTLILNDAGADEPNRSGSNIQSTNVCAQYAVCTVLFIPGSLLTLGAGYVFARAVGQGAGIALGVLVVWAGANVGAAAAFLLGRYVLRDAAGACCW